MRILLLTLYFPPLNTIAAHRLGAFASYLPEQECSVDTITRYYDSEQQKGNSMFLGKMAPSGFSLPYLRKDHVIYTNFSPENEKLDFSRRLPPGIRGLYNYWQVDVFHYGWIPFALEAFEKEWSEGSYDLILASYGPPVAMKLAKILSEKYRIPYVIDFRDSYIDERDRSYHLMLKKIVQHRYLKDASALIFSTEGMKDFFNRHCSPALRSIPQAVIYNGVDETEDPQPLEADRPVIEHFLRLQKEYSLLLLHTGTVYEGQNIGFFIRGVAAHNQRSSSKAAVVMLGAAENNVKELPAADFIHALSKISHGGALYIQKKASALLLPVWDGRYTGFSGKTQEYLHSGNLVMTSPDPQKDLNDFFALSPNVLIPKDETDLLSMLERLGSMDLKRMPLEEKNRKKLLRSFWVGELAKFLKKLK